MKTIYSPEYGRFDLSDELLAEVGAAEQAIKDFSGRPVYRHEIQFRILAGGNGNLRDTPLVVSVRQQRDAKDGGIEAILKYDLHGVSSLTYEDVRRLPDVFFTDNFLYRLINPPWRSDVPDIEHILPEHRKAFAERLAYAADVVLKETEDLGRIGFMVKHRSIIDAYLQRVAGAARTYAATPDAAFVDLQAAINARPAMPY